MLFYCLWLTVFGVGIFLAWIDRRDLILALRSYWWSKTEGRICQLRDGSFVIDGHNPHTPTSSVKYTESAFVYEFRIDGVRFQGTRVAFGGHVDRLGFNYLLGNRVLVFYDQEDPSRSVLRRGLGFGSIFAYFLIVTASIVLAIQL